MQLAKKLCDEQVKQEYFLDVTDDIRGFRGLFPLLAASLVRLHAEEAHDALDLLVVALECQRENSQKARRTLGKCAHYASAPSPAAR